MIQWWINDVLLADAGISGMTASFRTQATSQLSFSTVALFDVGPAFDYRAAVTIKRGETLGTAVKFFQGKIDRTNRAASPANEGHEYHVTDAWQDLEDTIYQESWQVGVGTFMFPKAVLGMNTAGTPITVGQQIADAVTYAAGVGVDIQAGTIAAGHVLWPQEVANVSVAEVIRQSLKFYPNHIAWIDYTTTPPTLNVTAATLATVRDIDLSGDGVAESLSVSRRDDLMPDAVRIVYTSATIIDSETYRDGYLDQYPASPEGGPRVLVAEIELAGMKMQFQKSPVRTRTLPTSTASAQAYLKKKFPAIRNVGNDAFSVIAWEKTHIAPDTDEVDDHATTTVNPNATRLMAGDVADLPRELVQGTIADWMRRKIGRAQIKFAVQPSPTATAGDLEALAKLPKGFQVVATDAITKIYKGPSQFELGDNRPVGLAEAYYTACHAAYQWEGSVSLVEQEAGDQRYHGCRVNIINSDDTSLTTMNAMVHAVDVDIDSGLTDISFGPAPHLAPADILEMQRQLRSRPVTWWSVEERDSNKLGAAQAPSSKGDTVTPYDTPETLTDANNPLDNLHPFELISATGGIVVRESTIGGLVPSGFSGGTKGFSGASGYVVGRLNINSTTGAVTSAELFTQAGSTAPANTDTQFNVLIGGFTTVEGAVSVWNDRYGPVDANICRNWFAASAPYYGVTFLGS